MFSSAAPAHEYPIDADDADALAHRGHALIERYCGKCMGSDRAKFELGIAALEGALTLGYEHPAEVHRLLADAYGQVAFIYSEPDSDDYRAARQAQMAQYRHLVELDPEDVEAGYELARTLDSDAERIAAIEMLLEIEPKNIDVRFFLGLLKFEFGERAEGLAMTLEAFDQAVANDMGYPWFRAYGKRLVEALHIAGRQQEAWEVEEKVEAAKQSEVRGTEVVGIMRQGRELIERYCGTRQGSDRAECERGIGMLERALTLGYIRLTEIHRLLADAYGQVDFIFSEPDSDEHRSALETQAAHYRRVVELDPEDVDARYALAEALDDEAEQLAALEELLAITPDHVDARFTFGQLEIARGNQDEGLANMLRAFDLGVANGMGYTWVRELGERLIQALHDADRPRDAREAEEKIEAARQLELRATEAVGLMRQGGELIGRHCGTCPGSDRGKFGHGIDLLERALTLGYTRPAEIHRLLADAYSQVALFFSEPDSADYRAARRAQMAQYRCLLELDHGDVFTLNALADVLDLAEVFAALEALLEIAPDPVLARFDLGRLKVALGHQDQGFALMLEAFDQLEGFELVRERGEQLIVLLREEKRPQEAREIEAKIEAVRRSERGVGDE